MKSSALRVAAMPIAFFATTSLALAHPGHDGDHGLTWDFSHLASHPAATAVCALVLVGATWGAAQVASALVVRTQSLRKSAASRGK